MRENIGLFRGLDPSSERFKWAYGGLVLVSDPFTHDDVFNIVDETGKHTQVSPESVGECTGLKDSNGRLIFENDIVTVKSLAGEYVMYITFENGEFALRSKEFKSFRAPVRTVELENTSCEVVGFMHDNTELYNCNADPAIGGGRS